MLQHEQTLTTLIKVKEASKKKKSGEETWQAE